MNPQQGIYSDPQPALQVNPDEELMRYKVMSAYSKYIAISSWVMIASAVIAVTVFYTPLPLGPMAGFIFALFAMLLVHLGVMALGLICLVNVVLAFWFRYGRLKVRFSTATKIYVGLHAVVAVYGTAQAVLFAIQYIIAVA